MNQPATAPQSDPAGPDEADRAMEQLMRFLAILRRRWLVVAVATAQRVGAELRRPADQAAPDRVVALVAVQQVVVAAAALDDDIAGLLQAADDVVARDWRRPGERRMGGAGRGRSRCASRSCGDAASSQPDEHAPQFARGILLAHVALRGTSGHHHEELRGGAVVPHTAERP